VAYSWSSRFCLSWVANVCTLCGWLSVLVRVGELVKRSSSLLECQHNTFTNSGINLETDSVVILHWSSVLVEASYCGSVSNEFPLSHYNPLWIQQIFQLSRYSTRWTNSGRILGAVDASHLIQWYLSEAQSYLSILFRSAYHHWFLPVSITFLPVSSPFLLNSRTPS